MSWEQRSGEELPTDSRSQGKCSSGKARRSEGTAGLVPISGGQGTNPYKEQKSLHEFLHLWVSVLRGQTVVAEKDAKTNVGVRNDCRNPHRVAADSFPSFPELNYS